MLRQLWDWIRGRDKVEKGWGCPTCGERIMDRLAWVDEGESVECQSCRTVYTLEEDNANTTG